MSQDNKLVITNPFTGAALKEAPDGTSLEGVTFKDKAGVERVC